MFGRFFRKRSEQPQSLSKPAEMPFGEDITNPDSRTLPPQFHGVWVRNLEDCGAASNPNRQILSDTNVVIGDNKHRVIAVRFIDTDRIAVVTLPAESDSQEYSLFYFGLSEGGHVLVDLENMDWTLRRCPDNT